MITQYPKKVFKEIFVNFGIGCNRAPKISNLIKRNQIKQVVAEAIAGMDNARQATNDEKIQQIMNDILKDFSENLLRGRIALVRKMK